MRKFQKLIEQKWLTQSLEGSQYLLYPPAFANVRKTWERYGLGYNYILVYIKNNYLHWSYSIADLKKITNKIISEEKSKPGKSKELIHEWETDEQNFLDKCHNLDLVEFKKISDAELIETFEEFLNVYLNEWALVLLTDAFSLYSQNIMIPLFKKYFDNKKELEKALQILTAPVDESFVMEEAISLFSLLDIVQKDARIKEAFKFTTDKRIKLLKQNRDFSRRLQEHTKKYFWIQNSYLDTTYLDEDYFVGKLAEFLKQNIDGKAKIDEMQEILSKAKVDKANLIKKINFDEDLLRIVNLVEQFAIWMDKRKKNNLVGNHYMMLFLDELCRRKNYTKKDWLGLIPPEFKRALDEDIQLNAIKSRSNESMLIYSRESIEILIKEEARTLFEILHEKKDLCMEEIVGRSASPGKAKGTVKIILTANDLNKMNKGDILVSSMTRPELVPAMEKAAGIITDEGGITCHAAIVSREMQKPCVVGTEIATKILKDGDFVEVDATHGIVKKIKEYYQKIQPGLERIKRRNERV